MEGPRAPSVQELPRVVDFLNLNLRPQNSWSITAEYPLALSDFNRVNMRVIWEDDQVLSHAVLKPLLVRSALGLVKVATIGSVVTSTQHRNQGLSQKIITDCLETAQQQVCDIAILWTSIHEFYRKMGFELAGTEVSLLFDKPAHIDLGKDRVVEGAQVSADAILRLFQQHTVNSLRTADEVQRLLQIPNSRVFTLWNTENQLLAYAVEGKGADLTGYVHEWGGSVSKILQLIGYIRNQRGDNLTVIVPAHAQNLIQKSLQAGVKCHRGFLGMIKLIHPNQFFTKVKRYARGQGVADLVLEFENGTFFLGVNGHTWKTQSENDVVRFLFGPLKPSEFTNLDPKTASDLDRILPLPFWIWGWDSI